MNPIIQPELEKTSDNSFTLIHPIYKELYHSKNGAFTESVWVFIEAGLNHLLERNKNQISILELGFGSGLNAALTLMSAQKNYDLSVFYTALEPYPISMEVANNLLYWKILDFPDSKKHFLAMHSSIFGEEIEITQYFTLEKFLTKFLEFKSEDKYNLVYYDAFAPSCQPELWTEKAFLHLNSLMEKYGVMVTYCAKGEVKRNLKKAGFKVESLNGPPGKREMIRATKILDIE